MNRSPTMKSKYVVGGNYVLGPRISKGSFGVIHHGLDINTNEKVAMKFEPLRRRSPLLLNEFETYKALQGGTGIPNVKWLGIDGQHCVLVMDLLGDTLEELFQLCNREFSLKCILMLAVQMLSVIEFVHSRDILHRDIKPDNLLIGRGLQEKEVFMVDFGLASKYRLDSTKNHNPFRVTKNRTGNIEFASRNTHFGVEQARRDDLESIGYVLLYFLRGSLPWEELRFRNKQKQWDKVREYKNIDTIQALCHGYPKEFFHYFKYCRSLGFTEEPDYESLRKIFRDLLCRQGYIMDYVYDWDVLKYRESNVHKAPNQALNYGGMTKIMPCNTCSNADIIEPGGRVEIKQVSKPPLPFARRNESLHANTEISSRKLLQSKSLLDPAALSGSLMPFTYESDAPGKAVQSRASVGQVQFEKRRSGAVKALKSLKLDKVKKPIADIFGRFQLSTMKPLRSKSLSDHAVTSTNLLQSIYRSDSLGKAVQPSGPSGVANAFESLPLNKVENSVRDIQGNAHISTVKPLHKKSFSEQVVFSSSLMQPASKFGDRF